MTVRSALSYKWALASAALLRSLSLVATVLIWRAVASGQQTVDGYTESALTSYLLLSAVTSMIFAPDAIFVTARAVKDGTLTALLLRPYSVLFDGAARFAAGMAVQVLVFLPAVLVLLCLRIVVVRPTPLQLILLCTNTCLLFTFGRVLAGLSFWLVEMWPLRPVYAACAALLGGALFPLSFYPSWAFAVARYSPFSFFGFVSVLSLEGRLSGAETLRYLAVAVAWLAVTVVALQVVWVRGLRKYEATNL